MFMTKALWVDFQTNTVEEAVLDFPKFSKLMKMDVNNDAQILTYEKH